MTSCRYMAELRLDLHRFKPPCFSAVFSHWPSPFFSYSSELFYSLYAVSSGFGTKTAGAWGIASHFGTRLPGARLHSAVALVTLLAVTLLSQSMRAEPLSSPQKRSGSVSVRVTDAGMEEPLPQADVRLYTFGHGTFSFQAYSDGSGRASFDGVPAGSYYIEVTKPGFEPVESIEVTTGALIDRSFRLRPTVAVASPPPGGNVSEAAMRIPAHARKEFDAGMTSLTSDPRASIAHYERAVALYPKYAEAYVMMALAYLHVNRHEDATKAVGKAIEADPKFSKAHTLGGRLLLEKRDFKNALAALEESLRLDPQGWDAHFELARCYYNMGKMSEALEEAQRARDLSQANTMTRLLLADIYLKQGRRREALAELDALVSADPNNPVIPRVRRKIAELRKLN